MKTFLSHSYQKIEVAIFKKDNTIMSYEGQKEIRQQNIVMHNYSAKTSLVPDE